MFFSVFIYLCFRSLIDVVYALKDEVLELKKVNVKFSLLRTHGLYCWWFNLFIFILQESKWMKQFLEDEQKSRKELERVVRKIAKQKNDTWDDGGHWTHHLTHHRPVRGSSSSQRRAGGGAGTARHADPSFLSLRCVFIFQSLIAESSCPHFDPLELDAMNPPTWNSLTSRDWLDERWTDGAKCCSKKKKKMCLLAAVTVNNRQREGQYQILSWLLSFSWTQTGILKPLSQHMVSCMHHCYQGDLFLSLAHFFFELFYLLQGIVEERQ